MSRAIDQPESQFHLLPSGRCPAFLRTYQIVNRAIYPLNVKCDQFIMGSENQNHRIVSQQNSTVQIHMIFFELSRFLFSVVDLFSDSIKIVCIIKMSARIVRS